MTALSRSDVDRFREVIARRLGLYFDDTKVDYLAGIARRRVESSGGGFEVYLRRLAANDPVEVHALAAQLTVGETYFFRYWDHWRAFTEVVLPERIARRAESRRLRIVSAGCASGEEAYSLAIQIREHLPDAYDVKIHAVDINPVVLEKAMRARYTSWSLREAPPALKARYFREERKGEFDLVEEIRSMVSFQQHNLLEDGAIWHPAELDVVFCRNVMMYFTEEVTRATVGRISRALSPGGFLFLGHAETLRGISHAFHLRHTHETFYYQLREGEPARSTSSSPPWGREPTPPSSSPQVALDSDDVSWVDLIQRASDRIAKLTAPAADASRATAAPSPMPAAWDLSAAVELLREERFAEALTLVQALPEPSQVDPDAQLLRAVLLTNSGQLAAAEEACARVLAIDELNAGAHYVMALCREHAGDMRGALEHDLSATYLDASFMMPHLHVGILSRRLGDLEQARSALRNALALLAREDPSRVLLFGGGFSREALGALCRSELRACGGQS